MTIAERVVQNQDKDEMLRRSLERNIQLYTDKSHFIYELLQNAEDAGATQIRFEQYEDRLVVLHNGHPFTERNLQGLCDIGLSDKTNDLNQIGEFGVGFKSVFGICKMFYLYSQPDKNGLKEGYQQFAVEVRDFTHPVDIEAQEVEHGYTTKFIFPYCVRLSFSGFSSLKELNQKLSERLQNLGITTLLFMKNLKSIEYTIKLPGLDTSGTYLLDKNRINDHCALVSALGENASEPKGEEISYLVFSRKVDGIQENRTIEIAFAVMVDENGAYTFMQAKSPYISVYFPTETESKLKFIVQGPYRTTPNRSSVPADNAENNSLAQQTAALLRDSVIELRDCGKLNYSFLNILPLESDVFRNAPLFECMFSQTKAMMTEEALLPCKEGSYAKKDSVKIARGAKFAEVLTGELLTELLNDGKEYHWLPTFLTISSTQYETLYKFLINVLKIEAISPGEMREKFNSNSDFFPNREDDWLVKFYQYYAENNAGAFADKGSMRTAKIIKTSKGEFVAPFRYEKKTWFPNVYLPSEDTEEMDDITFVDEKIYKQCIHFFTMTLPLKKPDKYAFFIADFKKRYENDEEITEEKRLDDFKKLLEYQKYREHHEEVSELIKKYLTVRCTKNGETVYVNPDAERVYFPENDCGSIEMYFAHISDDVYFVDVEFYRNAGTDESDLKFLGISDDIAIGMDRTEGIYCTDNPGRDPNWKTDGAFRWKLSLDQLETVLKYISSNPDKPDSMVKSAFIFHFLQNNEKHLHGTVHVSGNTINDFEDPAEIVKVLTRTSYWIFSDGKNKRLSRSKKWLFTKSRELVSQKDITKWELNTDLYGEVKPNFGLYELLGFKKSEEEKRKELENTYDRLDDATRESYFQIELERRYGISISDLDKTYRSDVASVSPMLEAASEEDYEFPSESVRNWDLLRKHAAEVLVYASPVEYVQKVRSVRVSRPGSEIKAYLRSKYHAGNKCFCQMCYKPVLNFEKCQIQKVMKTELEVMYLCMCPNCAAVYRQMRENEADLQTFLNHIVNLSEADIDSCDPVEIPFGNKQIWFTQTHIAEIRELMLLENKIDALQT